MLSRRPRTAGLVAAAAATTLALAPAAAGAATAGTTTIDLKGPAAKALSAQKVKLSAQRPAKATAKRLILPVARGTVASGATLQHGGSVTLRTRTRGRTRSAKLTAWQTKVGTRRSTVSAKLGRKRVTLLTIAAPQRRVRIDKSAGTASLAGGTARLTPAGAKALRRALGLRRLPAAQLGTVKVNARISPTAPARRDDGTPTNPNPGPGGGGGGTTPPGPTDPRCEGFGTGNVPEASAPLSRPTSGALGVSSAPMSWYVRDSWIRYINGGLRAGDGAIPSEGANAGPVEYYPEPTDTFRDPTRGPRLPYSFTFAFDGANSWYAPSSGTGRLAYTGTVRFYWGDHGIDITFKNPEIELNGPSSRMVFTIIGAACSNLPAKRVEMMRLAVPAPTGGPAGPFAYGPIATSITGNGATIFSGQYEPGQWWGSVRNLTVTTQP